MIAVAIAHVIVILAIAFLLYRAHQGSGKAYFWPALLSKLLSGIALALVYTHYYKVGDIFSYYKDGVMMADYARISPVKYLQFLWDTSSNGTFSEALSTQQPRALFLSKLTSVFSLITLDNFWVINLYYSLISFVATWYLYRVIVRNILHAEWAAAVALLFFPSVVFWTSGLIKETIAMACIFIMTALFLKLWFKNNISLVEWIVLALSLWICWSLKYYYLAVFLPVTSTMLVMKLLVNRYLHIANTAVYILLWLVVFLIPLFIASLVHPNFYAERFLDVIVSNYDAFLRFSEPGDTIVYDDLQANVWSMLKNSPMALFSGMFRPLPWESQNVFQLLLAFENSILLVLAAVAIPTLFTLTASPHRSLIAGSILYCVLLCIFLALSTPNFGTLARYRVGFLPFFVFLLLLANPFIDKWNPFRARQKPTRASS